MDTEELLEGLEPYRARSRRASWYGDARRLVAITAHGHGARAMDLLAYGLQHLGARELHLVVPRDAVNPTRARTAFLEATVHVHRTRRTAVGDAEPSMTRAEATAFDRRLGGVRPEAVWQSAMWPPWLVGLVDWLESRRVERVRTKQAHAWHYRGRQVLHVRRAATGSYTLIVGANYTSPRGDQPTPMRIEIRSEERTHR